MDNQFHFTFANLKRQYEAAITAGYKFFTCEAFCNLKKRKMTIDKVIVNRIDVDFNIKKAEHLTDIFNELGIKGTFFIRLHAPEYNPFSFESYRIIKKMINSGHEIGYHSEIVDQSIIWSEDVVECLKRDIDVINRMFNIKIVGVASHGGMTGLNNLDFWKDKKPLMYDLLYEGYDKESGFNLFQEAFYISDSEWTRWKCYDKGKLIENDRRSFAEHLENKHPLIYLLIHPDTYFNRHFYE
jgi:hypothetical protein